MGARAIRGRRSVRRASLILPGLLGLGLMTAACAGGGDPVATNTVQFRLDFGGGVTLASADYQLTGPNSFRRVGTLPVGDDPIVTATFQDLPAGQGYRIAV